MKKIKGKKIIIAVVVAALVVLYLIFGANWGGNDVSVDDVVVEVLE